MRLIDADKLIAQLEEDAKHMDDAVCQMMTYGAINDVKKQPTIDIAEPTQTNTSNTLNALDCDDLISRQAAIETIEKYLENSFVMDADIVLSDICYKLSELPSAERKGKWIERDEDCTWECSACGEPWTLIDGTPKQNGMNYCPNCGCDMRGEE